MSGKLVVIGSGPAALALVLRIALARPDWRQGVRVFDDGGGWLRRFRLQLRAAGCEHLRSPLPHHPHPDPLAMEEYLVARGECLSRAGLSLFTSTEQFSRFVDSVVRERGLERLVERRRVVDLICTPHGCSIVLDDGSELACERLVLAHNPRRARLPDCARSLLGAGVEHTTTLDVNSLDQLAEQRVVVVGGGHTAATLALHAVERGARVVLLARQPLRLRAFDFQPGWLSARRLQRFVATGPQERVDLALRARAGGSVPESTARLLRCAADSGKLRIAIGRVSTIQDLGSSLALRTDSETYAADRIWLATGSEVDSGDALVAALQRAAPCLTHRGYPLLDPDLSWPGTRVHVTGSLALSRLGPTAGNLHGHRWAAQIIGQHFDA